MMNWLATQARTREEMYAKPGRGGVQTTGAADEEEDEGGLLAERRFGIDVAQGKQKGKKDTKALQ